MREPEKTRDRLLETALQLVWQRNYDNVGVNEICSRAGVTKGAFYHHFDSKADLYYAASLHAWESMKRDLDELFSPMYSAAEQLEAVIDFIISKQRRERDVCEAEAGEGAAAEAAQEVVGCAFFTSCGQGASEEKVQQAAVEMSDKAIRYYTALVRNLKAEGVLRGDPDPEQLGRLMFQYVHGLLNYGRLRNSLAVIEADLREGIYRLVDLKAEHRRAHAPQRASEVA